MLVSVPYRRTTRPTAASPRRPAAEGHPQGRARTAAEAPFDDLSVSTISDRAGVARSGFYFYFGSEYAVLAQIPRGRRSRNFEELTHHFAPREHDELPAGVRQADGAAPR